MSRHKGLPPCRRCDHVEEMHAGELDCGAARCECSKYTPRRWWSDALDVMFGARV